MLPLLVNKNCPDKLFKDGKKIFIPGLKSVGIPTLIRSTIKSTILKNWQLKMQFRWEKLEICSATHLRVNVQDKGLLWPSGQSSDGSGSKIFDLGRVGLGQPSLVWVWVWKISPKNTNFFYFLPFGSGQKVPGSKARRPFIYSGSKVCSGWGWVRAHL